MTGECRWCGRQRKLCESHIIPEWAYRPVYDQDSRAIVIDSETRRRRKVQKGLWDYLLCAECEDFFNRRYDQPFHRFWSSPRRFPATLANLLAIEVNGIDYDMTRNFLLSILWRAHVSKQPILAIVKLGPHAAKIRSILKTESRATAGHEYPVYCFALRDPITGLLAKHCVLTPAKNRTDGQWNYEMAFLGCYWKVFVSRTEPTLPRSCRLTKAGKILMPVMNYPEASPIRQVLGLV